MSTMLEFAKDTARRAGLLLKEGLSGPREIRYKGEIDLVTEMDLASEKLILEAIRANYPDHAILAEESGRSESPDSPYRWVVDPLDGTTNYAHGLPIFCVSIGLEKDGEPYLGAIYVPMLDELYWAETGQGAYLNGQKLSVSKTTELGKALLVTGFPYDVKVKSDNLVHFSNFLLSSQAVRRLGSAATDLAWVAAGRFDGFWEPRLGAWDMCAGTVLVREAGGTVTNYVGGPFSIYEKEILASNGALHPAMMEVLTRTHIATGA